MEKLRRIIIYISLLLIFGVVMVCLIKINIVNSETLSPINNEYVNVEEEEVLAEYQDFINDNTFIKIYNNEDNFLFKVGEREYIICKDISLHTIIKNIFDKIEEIL